MQGTRVLPVLLALAVAAGFILHYGSKQRRPAGAGGPDPVRDARAFVENLSGLPFQSDPVPVALASEGAMRARIESYLDQRFGPSGLTQRTRALELLGVLPPGQNLRGQFLGAEATGARAWFDDLDGTLYLAPGFDPAQVPDRAALINGLCRLLVYQHHAPLRISSDDQWLAWRGVSGGLGASVEAAFRKGSPGGPAIPTSAETEREATLMALPIYLHGVAQFPVFEGKDFLEIPGARSTILTSPPAGTDMFFHEFQDVETLRQELEMRHVAARRDFEAAAAAPPEPSLHPGITKPSLIESLGALGVRLFFERHGDFEQATTLATHLDTDSYVLYSDGSGDHLRWVARFADPADAELARSLLEIWLQDPSPPTDQRFKKIVVDGSTLTLYNSSAPIGDQ